MKILLTEKEWEALQDEVSIYTDLVPETGEKKKEKIEFEMDPEDLDDLNGYVAATANHAENKKTERILDRIFDKIDNILRTQN